MYIGKIWRPDEIAVDLRKQVVFCVYGSDTKHKSKFKLNQFLFKMIYQKPEV